MLNHPLPSSKPTKQNSDLLTESEAADFLGVGPKTLAIWRSTKRYPLSYVKVGRLVRYYRSDLVSFLESRRVHGT
jgi:excisionase family DNA binding protein